MVREGWLWEKELRFGLGPGLPGSQSCWEGHQDLERTARALDCLMASQEPDPSLTSSGCLMNTEGMMGVGGVGEEARDYQKLGMD